MRALFAFLLVFGIGLLLYAETSTPDAPTPTPAPNGPDLLSAFRTNPNAVQARVDARTFGEICGALSDLIESDGRQPQPRIRTGVHIDDIRISAREMRLKGGNFGQQYPQLRTAVDGFMQPLLLEAGALDAAERQQWVVAFRTLKDSAFYAASQL